MIRCPACDAWTFIVETRTSADNTVRRRLECANKHRFNTKEMVEDKPNKEKPRT